MRLKISLELVPEKFGNTLPISYQYELTSIITQMMTENTSLYEDWLSKNNLTSEIAKSVNLFTISNLYIPKIFVEGDRLRINVPRIQFWISVLPFIGTEDLIRETLLDRTFVLGDNQSCVCFHISDISYVSPVKFFNMMEYQTLSPLVIIGLRPNKSIEYLNPHSLYFPKFMVEGLIERWENLYNQPYLGDRRYKFELLMPEKRKAVTIYTDTIQQQKVVGYMMKFRLYMAPELQEIAYTLGLGDNIKEGFGYIELLKKEAH